MKAPFAPQKQVDPMTCNCGSSTMTMTTMMKHSLSRDMGIVKDLLLSDNELHKKVYIIHTNEKLQAMIHP